MTDRYNKGDDLYNPDTEAFKLDVFSPADEAFFQLEFQRENALQIADKAARRRDPDIRGQMLAVASQAEFQIADGLREIAKYRDRKGQWL